MKALALFYLALVLILCVKSEEICGVSPVVVPKYKFSICTMVHNEGWYLEEWLAYHLLLRVDHFYIYNDDSTDRISEILAKYIEQGIVSLIPWNHTIRTVDRKLVPDNPPFTRPQRNAFADCLFNHQNESEYFGIWDIDEFAVLNDSFADMYEFLNYNKQYADDYQIPLTMYGSSGYTSTPDGLIIENFHLRNNITMFGMIDDTSSFSGKSLYKSGCGLPNIHFTAELLQPPGITCRKSKSGWVSAEGDRSHFPLSINHYSIKSWEHFKQKAHKWHFGLKKEDYDEQLETNIYEDNVLFKFVKPVQQLVDCMATLRKVNGAFV